MSKLEQIQTFIAVIEANGFAAAARKKGVTPAAISRQITALESNLGTQLLQRTTRQLSLTPVGEEYYQQCRKTLAGLEEAESSIIKSMHEATGVLQIMATRHFALTHLFPRLPGFMQSNPKLQIRFHLEERIPDPDNDDIDIIFGVSYDGPADWARKRVSSTRYILCASPAYLDEHGSPASPSELPTHSYITHSTRRPDNIITLRDEKKIQVNPTLWLSDSYAMRECAIRGLGVVNLHDYMVADAIGDSRLVEILREYQEPQKSIYLYYQQSRYLLPRIRRFIDFYTSC